ncbi:ABC transporter ATP-binding protein [Jeotgalibaca sp. A127]|uniref:ABC transporter ATP-binding protein n=1 Tax=Jeotgalibaca sp. A127 TaxID=3457324 RepID=UPI003FD02A49
MTKSYGHNVVLNNLSLTMEEGTLNTLLGPSGSGKSTLLRSIAGLEEIDSGHVYISEREVTELEPRNRNLGMVFQHYALFPNMSVIENVKFGLDIKKVSKDEKERRALEMIELVGLKGREGAYPRELSGGQQQRVALARSLVTEPDVLLLDEPLSALDAQIRVELRQQIKDIQKKLGVTVILVTHDQEEAMTMSEKIFVMNNGNIEQEGAPSDIYRAPNTEFVAGFIGNLNKYTSNQFETIFGERIEHQLIAVRPETVQLEELAGEAYHIQGVVRRSSMLGSVLRFFVDINGEELVIDKLNRSVNFHADGETIDLYLLKKDLIFIG